MPGRLSARMRSRAARVVPRSSLKTPQVIPSSCFKPGARARFSRHHTLRKTEIPLIVAVRVRAGEDQPRPLSGKTLQGPSRHRQRFPTMRIHTAFLGADPAAYAEVGPSRHPKGSPSAPNRDPPRRRREAASDFGHRGLGSRRQPLVTCEWSRVR